MTQADIIVIGGGMAGISAAARLSEHARVIALEAETQLGYHSTGRSAAIFILNYGNATLRALNARSVGFLEAPEGVSETSLLSPRGELLMATEANTSDAEDYAAGAEGLEWLTPAEAHELVPILRDDIFVAGLYEADAQGIDVDRMLQGFARFLRDRGGQIVTKARVNALTRSNGQWEVATENGSYSAPMVVNAGGAWAGVLGQMAGALPITLTPCRRSAALLPAPDGFEIDNWPVFGSVAEDWYAKPDAGKLMVSPADADPVEPQDAWPDDMVIAEGLHRYESSVTVPVTRVEHTWAGLRTFAPDKTPVVGFDPQAEGFFWLAGQGGYGIQTAPALADLACALCLGKGDNDTALLEALSPRRFA